MAAFAFRKTKARRADGKWLSKFGPRGIHMSDLHNRKGEFTDCANGGALLQAAVEIISDYAIAGVVTSIDVAFVKALVPALKTNSTLLLHLYSPYAICCHFAMVNLGRLVEEDIAYMLDQGDAAQGELMTFVDTVVRAADSSLRLAYRWRSLTTVSRKNARLIDTADILAWEWGRHVANAKNPQRPMRKSLAAILGLNPEEHQTHTRMRVYGSNRSGIHLEEEEIRRYCSELGAVRA